MNEPLKVSILDVNNRKEVKQVYHLYEKCVIGSYVRYKFKKIVEPEIIQKAIDEYYGKNEFNVLTQEDIEILKKALEPRDFYEVCLISKSENVKSRCYILKDENKIVGFQIAQLKETKKENVR